jgi:hypothetical protein
MTDDKKPQRPTLTLKGKGGKGASPASKPAAGAQEKPAEPPEVKAPPRVKGLAYTPPKAHEPHLPVFWMVMRSNGRRPQVRHLTLDQAVEEAQRIAGNNPAADVWVLECRTVATYRAVPDAAPGLQEDRR